jgi:hypothetical protein
MRLSQLGRRNLRIQKDSRYLSTGYLVSFSLLLVVRVELAACLVYRLLTAELVAVAAVLIFV